MSAEHDLAKAIADAVSAKVEAMRPESTTMPATYQGTDSEGKGWVLLPGATEPTPVSRMAVEAAQGDTVSVTVANGKATVDSNVSNPSAGLAGVKVVERTANTASATASEALTAASDARSAANSAQASADTARQAATDATVDAATARSMAESATADAATASASAAIAKENADKATFALSDVENVVGTLNWIAEHGEYVLTSDTAIVDGKAYYTRSGTAPDYVYTVVASPDASELSTYYELQLDESVQNYLASHLWLDDYGLNLSVDSANGYRVHQGTVDGTHSAGAYIIDQQGAIVASFGASGFQVGLDDESHLVGDYHSLQLLDKEGNTYFHVSDLRNASGYATVTETFTGDGFSRSFTVQLSVRNLATTTVRVPGAPNSVSEVNSHTVTLSTVPPEGATVIITYQTSDPNTKAYSLGHRKPLSDIGTFSFAEGYNTEASGNWGSHAEGISSTASGFFGAHAEGKGTTASGQASHAEGGSTTASGASSHSEGEDTVASGRYGAHAEGKNTTASGDYGHAEGFYTAASNSMSHAEGDHTEASGSESHAEGQGTTASGSASHAEGAKTIASGFASHAEGYYKTTASGDYGHAEGYRTTASGSASHAQNYETIAASDNQTALGKYNVEDANGDYAVIVGNGTSDSARSNALTVGWDGNVAASGDVTAKSGSTTHSLAAKANASSVVAGTPSMSPSIGSTSGASQIWAVIASCINANNTTYNGHRCYLVVNNDGVSLWDSTASATKWALGGLTTVNNTASQIVTAASGITVTGAHYAVCGKMVTVTILARGFSTTTGSKTLGTIASDKRPAIEVLGVSNTTRTMYQSISTGGVVTVYWLTAPGSTSDVFTFTFSYLLP